MRRNVRWIGYVVVLAATLAVTLWMTRRREPAAAVAAGHRHGGVATGDVVRPVDLSAADARRIGVTFAVARRGAIGREIRTVGQITFDETRVRTITARVDGWVESLAVDQTGQYVASGAPLLTIYSPMLVSAQEELLLAARLVTRVGGGTAAAQRDAAELLDASRRRLSQWDLPDSVIAAIERSGEPRRSLTLRSSVSGYVLEKSVLSGERIMPGEPLYKVADLGTLWAEGEVFEQDLAAVRPGQQVQVSVDALPGVKRDGRIGYVYPTINPETRTARIRVVLANAGGLLKPGMYATLVITGVPPRESVVIPRAAVLTTGERSIVFVRDADGRLSPREVVVGSSSGDEVEVMRGLAAGESVVASATFLVDAESNLGTALGGMGDMPGMEITRPPRPLGLPKER
jgi:membrane fusion protein, copper/silver efflux system